ncbi:MAG: hypothetical protein ACI9JM_000645 [Halioglobus sp.]
MLSDKRAQSGPVLELELGFLNSLDDPLALSPELVQQVAVLLGRQPRGLEEIAVARADGQPMVIRVASLVDDKPFPTLYWLIDPDICYRIDQAEAGGLIKAFQQRVDEGTELQKAMREDHQKHIQQRQTYMSVEIEQKLKTLNYGSVMATKGIGGIGDFSRIRCLHTWYGAHLVAANTIGTMLDQWWQLQDR